MKTNLLLSGIIFAMLACSGSKTNQESVTDSLESTTDTARQIKTKEKPTIYSLDMSRASLPKFFKYSTKLFIDSSEFFLAEQKQQEVTMTAAVDSLLSLYAQQKYFSITSKYRVDYEVGNDYDDGKEAVSKTESTSWYVDQNARLRIVMSKLDWVETHEKSILLISADQKLEAIYSDQQSGGQDFVEHKKRALSSLCPSCGYDLELSYHGFRGIDYSEMEGENQTAHADYDKVLDWLSNSVPKIGNGNYLFLKTEMFDEISYTIEYRVNSVLFDKFIKLRNR